jgi:hypothetical protein
MQEIPFSSLASWLNMVNQANTDYDNVAFAIGASLPDEAKPI